MSDRIGWSEGGTEPLSSTGGEADLTGGRVTCSYPTDARAAAGPSLDETECGQNYRILSVTVCDTILTAMADTTSMRKILRTL